MAVVAPAAALEAIVGLDTLNQIVGQAVQMVLMSLLAPDLDALRVTAYDKLPPEMEPPLPLAPAEAVQSVLRGYKDLKWGAQEARFSGLSAARFEDMVDAAGQPLPALTLLEAFRRGLIAFEGTGPDKVTVEQGIRESDTKNKYIPLLKQLQYQLADPGTVVEARLRGYITPAEFDKRLNEAGFDADVRHLMYVAAGVPISPSEGYAAFHRKLIPEDSPNPDTPSLAQIFRESRINDKYLKVWMALQTYAPPPRTVTALLRAGSITEAQAKEWFSWSGLNDEQVTAYIADASHQKTMATKELAVGTVVNMYKAKELSRDQATAFITARGYTVDDAAFLLDYADFQLVEAQVSALVSRVRTYYVGHKISKQTAADSLANVGMAADTINHLLAVWDQEANASPVLLTTTQLANAAAKGWIDPAAAYEEIQGRGYDARDAWVLLAEHKTDMTDVPTPAGILKPQ